MDIESTFSGHNLAFLEALYEAYQRDPSSVDPQWIPYFRDLSQQKTRPLKAQVSAYGSAGEKVREAEQVHLQARVDQLIEHYRLHGHLAAQIDPLQRQSRPPVKDLDPAYLGLGQEHMDRLFDPGNLMPSPSATLAQIYQRLQNTYTRHIGVEYWHIRDLNQRMWLQAHMESCENKVIPPPEEQYRLLSILSHIEGVDKFLHAKFLGAKRFSIAGAESMIAILDCLIEEAGEVGIHEVIFGMAHRGRLNVLMNILGKTPQDVFSEFQKGDPWANLGSGDVKYHMGHYRTHQTTKGKEMYLALTFNPSHLEAISPVVQGRVRAKQDTLLPEDRFSVMGVTMHGDAAFAGQGVVQETLNLARLPGYQVGGTIRIVINNQIGFTTNPDESRSTMYATDIAHMLQVPIFHIHGDDVEAAAYVARLAVNFRQKFQQDVIIDLNCYRKYGHNEGDDPTFTQPTMYQRIQDHPSVRTIYQQQLLERETVQATDCQLIDEQWAEEFNQALAKAEATGGRSGRSPMHGIWEDYHGGLEAETAEVSTAVSTEKLAELAIKISTCKPGFHLHPKLERLLLERREMLQGKQPINWATAELAAYATLLVEGTSVRFSGQDSQRGTFSHRHAVFTDLETGEHWSPLENLADKQGKFEIFNSPLSEFSILGFEFGYSLISPCALSIWEAQFGDFCNGAQVIIDNFLSASEDKWNRLSGLVMMLPHGFEGQGPEHSSARLERFLQLSAEDNIQVCNLTTPAQLFHVLRRQVLRKWRKPLVLMTPKSLLRFRPSFSELRDLSEGHFARILDDVHAKPEHVIRILLCSGKVFYDLREEQQQLSPESAQKVAIIRMEQLYPFPDRLLKTILSRYGQVKELMWVQEEPKNMGAWSFIFPLLFELLGERFGPCHYVGRIASASPATGSPDSHALERKLFLEAAFANL